MKNKSMWDGVLRACGLAPVIGARGVVACQTRLDAPTRPAPPMPECKPPRSEYFGHVPPRAMPYPSPPALPVRCIREDEYQPRKT